MNNHNHLAVWIMVVANQVLGYLWYAPFLFLNPWLAGQERTPEQLSAMGPTPLIWSIVTNVLATYTLSWLVFKLNVNGFMAGAKLGFILFTGFSLLALGAHYKFLGIADSVMLIDLGALLIWTVLAAGMFATWKRKI